MTSRTPHRRIALQPLTIALTLACVAASALGQPAAPATTESSILPPAEPHRSAAASPGLPLPEPQLPGQLDGGLIDPAQGSVIEDADPLPLSDHRWQDREYGLSLNLPIGIRQTRRPADHFLLRAVDEDEQFVISASIRTSPQPLNMLQVLEEAKSQVLGVHFTSELLDEYVMYLDEMMLAVVLFRTPQHGSDDDAFLAQGLVQIDPQMFAVIEFAGDWAHAPTTHATFIAVLETLELRGIDEINQQRAREIERTERWRRGVGLSTLHDALIERQLFRIVEDGTDIGYMEMRQSQAEQHGKPGIQVEVQSKLVLREQEIDGLSVFFSADDDTSELWEITSTRRPRVSGGGEPQTFRETGIRTGNSIVVTHDTPFDSARHELTRPATGYVPLAETWMLPQILPDDRPATFGFYAYNADTNSLTYRTEQVTPTLSGFTIESRPRPRADVLEAEYDADRQTRRRQLTPRRELIPTTARELEQRWRNR